MDEVEEALDNLQMAGSEVAYRAQAIAEYAGGANLPHKARLRLTAASRKICELVNTLGAISVSLGLPERPQPYTEDRS